MRTTKGANWNVIGLTDLGGSLVEHYEAVHSEYSICAPFGKQWPRTHVTGPRDSGV